MNDILGKKHKKRVIEVAIQEYRDSICFGAFTESVARAIEMMEQAYYMCSQCPYYVEDIGKLKKEIESAHQKYEKELGAF